MRGPIPAGEQNDLTMFCGGKQEDGEENWEKSALYFKLKDGQKMIGDQIYEGIPHKVTVRREGQSKKARHFIKRVSARQEIFHGRLAAYQVLRQEFRHNKDKLSQHKMCAEAVCVIVQFDLKYHPLPEV